MAEEASAKHVAPDCNDEERLTLEREFMHCLASPYYLHWLGQNEYLQDERFVRFLHYLEYWRKPEYAKSLRYPHCLHFLTLLQSEQCRRLLPQKNVADWIAFTQFHFWQHHRANQLKSGTGRDGTPPYTVPLHQPKADNGNGGKDYKH